MKARGPFEVVAAGLWAHTGRGRDEQAQVHLLAATALGLVCGQVGDRPARLTGLARARPDLLTRAREHVETLEAGEPGERAQAAADLDHAVQRVTDT